ncbi:Hypothetical predicted protein [Podarcis lilfordi]|uniref:Uncharacterized protein n=1 Tax=Podarcis lilfordi TaxID=74358 RepID=A0AA35NWV9_9SAUR|nr:Hypothetical predicted protein [Podarcis lilfordi]
MKIFIPVTYYRADPSLLDPVSSVVFFHLPLFFSPGTAFISIKTLSSKILSVIIFSLACMSSDSLCLIPSIVFTRGT